MPSNYFKFLSNLLLTPLWAIVFALDPTSFAAFKPCCLVPPPTCHAPSRCAFRRLGVLWNVLLPFRFFYFYFSFFVVADVFVAHIRIVRSIVC